MQIITEADTAADIITCKKGNLYQIPAQGFQMPFGIWQNTAMETRGRDYTNPR